MRLSVIVCVFNEIKTIEKILHKIDNAKLPNNIQKEIIIIDNNSSDGTKEFLEKIPISNNLKIFFQKKNLGKGNSIIKGIKESTGDLIVFQDADLEYDPNNFSKLVNHLLKNKLDAVFGSRIKNGKVHFHHGFNNYELLKRRTMKYYVILLTKLINLLYRGSFTDVATNHKLIKREVLNKLNLVFKGFTLDFEISLKLAKYKFRYDEIPIEYHPRTDKEGKKINLLDGIKSFFVILYFFFRK